jgi:hypothetical protein
VYQAIHSKKQVVNTLLASAVILLALLPWLTSVVLAQSSTSDPDSENQFPSTAKQANTSIVQQIGEQGLTVPQTPIFNENAQFYSDKVTPNQRLLLNTPGGFPGDFDQDFEMKKEPWQIGDMMVLPEYLVSLIIGSIQYFSSLIAPFIAKFLIWILNQSVYNFNLAAGEPKEIAQYIQPLANIMRAIAFDLLLLMFILSIWKYWTEAAWKGGNLMGAVGRLIMTGFLLIGWNTLSDYIIQISNDLTSQILFGPQDVELINTAMTNLVTLGLGAVATSLLGEVLGGISFFSLLLIVLLQGMYLLVLKATQVSLLVAQYVFAPIFLVCYATTTTEKTATGFIRSFVEVSLWTFVWIGLLRILVIILASDWNAFGKIITLIGTLQLMVSVPQFIAKAQISPASELFEGGAILFSANKWARASGFIGGAGSPGGFLKQGFNKLADKFNDPGTSNRFGGGAGGAIPTLRAASGGGGTPPGTSPPPGTPLNHPFGPPSTGPTTTAVGTPLNPAFSGPPTSSKTPTSNSANNTQVAAMRGTAAAYAAATSKSGKGAIAEKPVSGSGVTPVFGADGQVTGLEIGDKAPADQVNRARLAAQMANNLMSNQTASTGAALRNDARVGTLDPKADKGTTAIYNGKLGAAAFNGAADWINGTHRNSATGTLLADPKQGGYGGAVDHQNRSAVLTAMGDKTLPHSPNNGSYSKNEDEVKQAGLDATAAPMAAISTLKSAGAKVTTGSLPGAYRALGAAVAKSPLLGGLTPGTIAHDAALGRAIQGLSPDKVRAAAVVGAGLTGTHGAGHYSDEDVEAMVEATETVAASGYYGGNHARAFNDLAAMATGTSNFGGTGTVQSNMSQAGKAIIAMRQLRAPNEAFTSPSLLKQVFALSDHKAERNTIKRALTVAGGVGYDTYTHGAGGSDYDDVEQLEQKGYTTQQAVGELVTSRAFAGAVQVDNGQLGSRNEIELLRGIGYGMDEATTTVSRRFAEAGFTGQRASAAARRMVHNIYKDVGGKGKYAANNAKMDDVRDEVIHADSDTLSGYVDLSNNASSSRFNHGDIEEAAPLFAEGIFAHMPESIGFVKFVETTAPSSSSASFNGTTIVRAVKAMHNSGWGLNYARDHELVHKVIDLSYQGKLKYNDASDMKLAFHEMENGIGRFI